VHCILDWYLVESTCRWLYLYSRFVFNILSASREKFPVFPIQTTSFKPCHCTGKAVEQKVISDPTNRVQHFFVASRYLTTLEHGDQISIYFKPSQMTKTQIELRHAGTTQITMPAHPSLNLLHFAKSDRRSRSNKRPLNKPRVLNLTPLPRA